MLTNFEISLTNKQIEEISKFCFDLAKLSLSSLVFTFFINPEEPVQVLVVIVGLTMSVMFFTLGVRLLEKI